MAISFPPCCTSWLGIAVETFLFCGLSVRDDAIERQNIVAYCGISGALSDTASQRQ
ncbi:MAG: hypothetical protein ACYTX0_38865 [Nostoc sp.]